MNLCFQPASTFWDNSKTLEKTSICHLTSWSILITLEAVFLPETHWKPSGDPKTSLPLGSRMFVIDDLDLTIMIAITKRKIGFLWFLFALPQSFFALLQLSWLSGFELAAAYPFGLHATPAQWLLIESDISTLCGHTSGIHILDVCWWKVHFVWMSQKLDAFLVR